MAMAAYFYRMALKNIVVQLYFVFSYLLGFGQGISTTKVAPLPPKLTECSGMVALGPNSLCLINDGGHAPALFIIDTLGNLKQEVPLPQLQNKDWESLALADDVLFIGDFGNNKNKRKDLVIYRLKVSGLADSGHYQVLEPIYLAYQNQQNYPPGPAQLNFDVEAMVALKDSLYLFTKNRTRPFDGFTYAYTVPQEAGSYALNPRCALKLGSGVMPSYWVTGASYQPAQKQLALLGYDKLWLLNQAEPPCLLGGSMQVFYFNRPSQKEALTWLNGQLYWADEKTGANTGYLYKSGPNWQQTPKSDYTINLSQKTVLNDTAIFSVTTTEALKVKYEVLNMQGQRQPFGKVNLQAGENLLPLALNNLPPGTYVINLMIKNKPHAYFIKKVNRYKKKNQGN
jgi:hypothetical protein